MVKYFIDENKELIKAELLDVDAKAIAETFVERFRSGEINEKGAKTLSSAQLRRFYGDFKQIEKKVNTHGFAKVKPLIKMVKSKAAYASNPKRQGRITDTFKKFLQDNVDAINDEKDFMAFMLHFEAVVGFYYGLGVSNR